MPITKDVSKALLSAVYDVSFMAIKDSIDIIQNGDLGEVDCICTFRNHEANAFVRTHVTYNFLDEVIEHSECTCHGGDMICMHIAATALLIDEKMERDQNPEEDCQCGII